MSASILLLLLAVFAGSTTLDAAPDSWPTVLPISPGNTPQPSATPAPECNPSAQTWQWLAENMGIGPWPYFQSSATFACADNSHHCTMLVVSGVGSMGSPPAAYPWIGQWSVIFDTSGGNNAPVEWCAEVVSDWAEPVTVRCNNSPVSPVGGVYHCTIPPWQGLVFEGQVEGSISGVDAAGAMTHIRIWDCGECADPATATPAPTPGGGLVPTPFATIEPGGGMTWTTPVTFEVTPEPSPLDLIPPTYTHCYEVLPPVNISETVLNKSISLVFAGFDVCVSEYTLTIRFLGFNVTGFLIAALAIGGAGIIWSILRG